MLGVEEGRIKGVGQREAKAAAPLFMSANRGSISAIRSAARRRRVGGTAQESQVGVHREAFDRAWAKGLHDLEWG